MGKKYSKQAWLSREGPEGDCVIENDTTASSSLQGAERRVSDGATHTADFTYKGYPVNLEGPFDLEEKLLQKKKLCNDFPIEVVDLPDEPDGKGVEITFGREGLVEVSTQTKPLGELMDGKCYQVKLPGSAEHQEWSYTLYDFEGQGHVTRQDIKNLVKSMYEVLGKSVSHSKNPDKEPVKTLRVRLSVCKEGGKEETKMTSRECVLTASSTRKHHKHSRRRVDKTDSIVANPPSIDNIDNLEMPHGSPMREQAVVDEKPEHHKKRCKKCNQSSLEKEQATPKVADTAKVSQGLFQYPKRMQTGPGECHPTVPMENEMSRVKEWINQCCESLGTEQSTTVDERGSRKHRSRSRHRSCQHHHCDSCSCRHQCSQYLDLATDHVTYPYHVEEQRNSPRLAQHCNQKSEHCHCQQSCHVGQPVVHRHVHRHHHSHHHYHHYTNN